MSSHFDAQSDFLGGFHPLDGTMEFYGRIRSVLNSTDVVVDLGAGRGAWYFEDKSKTRPDLRNIKPVVRKVIGLDVDPIVIDNPTTTENHLIIDNKFPLEDETVNVIICDYVLEHICDISSFFDEVDRILIPGGYFFARTPHKYHYVSIAARLTENSKHAKWLSILQPYRKAQDVFPTAYRLNTIGDIGRLFKNYSNYTYLYVSDPSYYCASKTVYRFLSIFHRHAPLFFVSNLFVFLQKPQFKPENATWEN
jgi:SAM-dependent methyltransferase